MKGANIMKGEEITLKNTKAEILDALNEALEREKNMAKMKYEPEKEEKKQKVEKAIAVSKENVEQKIFSEELNNKFKDLETAIQAEEEKLKELYGVENELNNLVVVVNAGKDYMAELEIEKKVKIEELNNSIKELEEQYKTKKEELEKEYDAKAKALKIERDREVEEYNYKLKREREISNNKWEDEKRERENNLTKKETEVTELLAEAESNAEHIQGLESKVNEIPSLLEKEYARGRKEVTAELEKEHKYATELLKKDFQNTIDRQNDKIELLKEEVEKSNAEKSSLQEKLDQAYNQIKEMATKTVEATGGVKILGNNASEAK
jgi:hypothetical protein